MGGPYRHAGRDVNRHRRDDGTIRAIGDLDLDRVVALWRACGLTVPHNDPLEDIAFCRRPNNATISSRVMAPPALHVWEDASTRPVRGACRARS